MEYISHSADDTEKIAEEIAKNTTPPHVFCLTGDLGAGKTAFTRGLATGFGYDGRVSSPTFTIMNIYEGRETINHFDLYRLKSDDEFFEIGVDQYLLDNISVVEWPDEFMDLMGENKTVIQITRLDEENSRLIKIL